MPDDPNQSVEQQLQAWVQKRRQEAGPSFELHPATRKLLQDEVARTFPKSPAVRAPQPGGWWTAFWPRLALAGGISAVLVALVGIFLPGVAKTKSKGQQLALVRNQGKNSIANSDRRDTPAQVVPEDKPAVETQVSPLGDKVLTAPVAESTPARGLRAGAENKPLEPEIAVKAEPKDARLRAIDQRFSESRRYRVNFNSPPMPNVLRSFEIAQDGQQIRVVDADGSVYDGAIQSNTSAEMVRAQVARISSATDLKKALKPAESASMMRAGEPGPAQNAFFRVAGTNRTLNQLVVFEGNFLATANPTNEVLPEAKVSLDKRVVAPRQSLSLQSQQVPNSSIQGQATIGEGNRIQINAVPVEP